MEKELIDVYKELEEQSLAIENIYNDIKTKHNHISDESLYNLKTEIKKEEKIYEQLDINNINNIIKYINEKYDDCDITPIDIITSSENNYIQRIIRKLTILKKKKENNLFTDMYMGCFPLITITDNYNNNYQNMIEIYNLLFLANYIITILKNKNINKYLKETIIYKLSYIEPNLERYFINKKYNIDYNELYKNILKIKELYFKEEVYRDISMLYIEDKIKSIIQIITENNLSKENIEQTTDICIAYTLTEIEEESKIFIKYLKQLLKNDKYKNNYATRILLRKTK